MAGVVWTVKEGKRDEFSGPVLATGYRSRHTVREPSLCEVLQLADGLASWRVVDWKMTNRSAAPGNVLVVEFVGG
jgi:hypothetical protein